jgi:hypothetical protein
MKSQFEYLSGELLLMDELIEELADIVVPSEGCFMQEKRGKRTYYYLRKKGEKNRKYIGTSDSVRVKQIKQNEMARVLLKTLESDRKKLNNCLSVISRCSFENIKNSLPPKYSAIDADLCIDNRLNELIAWANMDYEKNKREYPSSKNVAKDGTRMRSKGEVVWYNLLKDSGIPFRYDCIMTFTDRNGFSVKKAPDFLIQCYDGSFIIIEHLGMLDEDYYSKDFIEKAQIYQISGYVIGSNFFITSDDIHRGTDSQAIERTIELVKLRFLDGAPAEVKLLF